MSHTNEGNATVTRTGFIGVTGSNLRPRALNSTAKGKYLISDTDGFAPPLSAAENEGMKTLIRSKLIVCLLVGISVGYAFGSWEDSLVRDGTPFEYIERDLMVGVTVGLLVGLALDAWQKSHH